MDIFQNRNIRRAKNISNFLKGSFKEGEKIIDIGLGNGFNSAQLKKDYRVSIEGIDVIDYNQSEIPFRVFDGKNIPYKDNSFDTALIIEVLHHCDYQLELLLEATRVAKRIIIMEDVYTSRFHLIMMKIYDYIANIRHGVNIPFKFRKNEEWLRTFKKENLKIEDVRDYKLMPFYVPMKTKTYFLRK